MSITKTNKLNMTGGAVPLVIHLSQYDADFTLIFDLYNTDGTFTIESGTTVEIKGTKASGTGYSATATLDISNKRVTVTGNAQMTAVKGRNIYELSLIKSDKRLHTANFILEVEPAALDADTITDESVLKELNAIIESAETATEAAETATEAAQNAEAAAEIFDTAFPFTNDAKIALLDCLRHLAWIDEDGQNYYDAFNSALSPKRVSSISATFVQGQAVIYSSDDLDVLRPYLTVTATYEDQSSAVVYGYSLTGTLEVGTSIIIASYGGKTTTFMVNVSRPYWDYEWYASSNELPDGIIYRTYNFTDNPGFLTIDNANLVFETGDCELYVKCKSQIMQNRYGIPQLIVINTDGYGARVIMNNNSTYHPYFAFPPNSGLDDSLDCRQEIEYTIKCENGVFEAYVNGALIKTGSGIQSQYNVFCGIAGNPANESDQGGSISRLIVSEIKYRKIQ